jgi:tripartite-type tricarboxylate transporter receptor subunit TctC
MGFASLNPSYDPAMIAGADASKSGRCPQLLCSITKLELHGAARGHRVMRRLGLVIIVSLALAASALGAWPEPARYPGRSVRVIVPYAPGGVVDVMARLLARGLSESLNQQFYVENMGGGGGNIGTRAASLSPPDGYTVLITSSSFIINPILNAAARYDPVRDFVPVTVAGASPNVLVVYPGEAARSVSELIDAIRRAPRAYSFASPGVGTTAHLTGERFRLSTHTDLVHVPFSGAGPAAQATVAGQTRIAFINVPPAVALVKAGSLRALAVTRAARSSALPDVPTMAEAGLSGHEAETLLFVLVPAGTAPEIVALLNREVRKALERSDVRQTFDTLGFEAVGGTLDEAATRVRQEIAKWAKVIQDANLKQ